MFPKTIKEIARGVQIVIDIGLHHQDRDVITTFSNSKGLINPTSGTPPETATIRGITLKFAFQITPKTAAETEVPVCSVVMKRNANIVAETIFPAVSAKHNSIVAKKATLGTIAAPDAKIQTESTCVSARQLHRELKKPPTDGMFILSGGWQKCFRTSYGLRNSAGCRL